MAAKMGHMVSREERRDGGEKEKEEVKERGDGGREGKEERNEK